VSRVESGMPDEVVRREPSGRDGDLRPLLFKSGCLSYAGGFPSRLKAISLNISPCWYRPLNLSWIRGLCSNGTKNWDRVAGVLQLYVVFYPAESS
jgi:hypothetical protein